MGSLDLRSAGLFIDAYPGNQHTVTLTWPSGSLSGTAWTATIDGSAVDSVTISGDDLEIVFTTPTTDVGTAHPLVITQTDVDPDWVRITGSVTPSYRVSATSTSTTVTVATDTATTDVTVVGGTGSTSGGGISATNSPQANEFARFTNSTTIEGRTAAEVRSQLNVEDGAAADQTASDIVGEFTGTPDGSQFLRDDGTLATPAGGGSGVDTSGTPVATDFARFTDADTIEGRSPTQVRTDLNVEDGATADQTAGEIKTAYESNADTNAFTDSEQTKLAGVESGATTDQTASEIVGQFTGTPDNTQFLRDDGTLATPSGSGTVDTSGTPATGEFARFTDADTIEGRTAAQTRSDISAVAQADFDNHSARHENTGADEISVAGLSGELADPQPPKSHNLGGSEHGADTLANLNTKVSDATLDDSSGTRDPTAHALGGSAHSADTLANLNTKVSDATLDDSSDTRDPNTHSSSAHSDDYPIAEAGAGSIWVQSATPTANATGDIWIDTT